MSSAERILAILSRVAQTDEVKDHPDLGLYELAILDSLRTVELMAAFSMELGVEVSPAELDREDWETPAKIVRYIENRLGSRTAGHR
jgi:D-alanine--poly(phosphoribitol) ligase subunit 2